jgi:hypothetical protein
MTIHIFNCPKCGIQHEWEKFPPPSCKNCGAVFDIKWESEYLKKESPISSEKTSDERSAKDQQFCKNCGKKITRTTKFCGECGTKLDYANSAMVTESGKYISPHPEPIPLIIKKEEILTIYDSNAFRILGIECNADRKTVKDVQQSLKVRAKLGGPIHILDPLGFLNATLRDEISIRNAVTQIEASRPRISERLFWFVNFTEKDGEALEKLKDGQCNEAAKIWNTTDDLSASINLAILCHACCITKDIEAVNTEKWTRVFERWQKLINDEKYWAFLEAIEQQSGFEPTATHDDFNALKNDIWNLLLKLNLECMKKARDTNLDDVVQRHIELIRSSNFPVRSITEAEYEIFSPLEGEISKDLEEIEKSVLANRNSSLSKSGKKAELDRLVGSFETKIKQKINRLLKFVGSDSDSSKNIREKTATCLREISISYHNDADAFEISLTVLVEASKYAEGTSLSARFNQDYSIISQHAKESQEFEKFVEYQEKIGNSELKISKTQISFKNQTYNIQDITGIRYGIYQESVNGIPTSRSYAIWLKCGDNQGQIIPSSAYIPPTDHNVMMIECADATWFGVDKIQNRFDEIVKRLYPLIQIPLINKMIQDFESGKRIYVSSIIIDLTGIYKDFNYDPLSKGVISLALKNF